MRFLDFQIGAMAMIWLTRGAQCFDDSLSDLESSERLPILYSYLALFLPSKKEGLFWNFKNSAKFWFTLHVLVTFPCGAAWLGGLCLLRPSLLSLPPQTINPSLLAHITALLLPDLVKATTVFWSRSKKIDKCIRFSFFLVFGVFEFFEGLY